MYQGYAKYMLYNKNNIWMIKVDWCNDNTVDSWPTNKGLSPLSAHLIKYSKF